ILSAFDGGETIGDMILKGAGVDDTERKAFDLLVKVVKAVNSIDLNSNTHATVTFGDINLTGDVQNAGGLTLTNIDTSHIQGVIGDIFGASALASVKDDLQSLAEYTGAESQAGFKFPILETPGPILAGIRTGQPGDMFTFSTGREHFELAPSIGVGIPGISGIFLKAGIVFDAQLTMGYDTAGLI